MKKIKLKLALILLCCPKFKLKIIFLNVNILKEYLFNFKFI